MEKLIKRTIYLTPATRDAAERCSAWMGAHACPSSVIRRAVMVYADYLDTLDGNSEASNAERIKFLGSVGQLLRKRAKPAVAAPSELHQ